MYFLLASPPFLAFIFDLPFSTSGPYSTSLNAHGLAYGLRATWFQIFHHSPPEVSHRLTLATVENERWRQNVLLTHTYASTRLVLCPRSVSVCAPKTEEAQTLGFWEAIERFLSSDVTGTHTSKGD